MKYFSMAVLAIASVMVVLLSLTGAAVLVNNFGNVGFLIAPFVLLVIAAALFFAWYRFTKYFLNSLTKEPK